jgi:hypothetical protein
MPGGRKASVRKDAAASTNSFLICKHAAIIDWLTGAYVGERTHRRLQKVNIAACDVAQGYCAHVATVFPYFSEMGWEVLRKDPLDGTTAD